MTKTFNNFFPKVQGMILDEPTPELLKACEIAAKVREYGRGLIKPGKRLLEVTEAIENRIIELGGECAFPPQISLNHIAAHFCPDTNDETVFSDQVCKLDVGVHVKGYIGDTACTVDLSGKHSKLILAAEDALESAIKAIKPGVQVREIGRVIQIVIARHGFSPVRNLSGHGLDSYGIHTQPNVPNYDNGDTTRLEKGQLIAIEPFSTPGSGLVQEGTYATLFSLVSPRPVRMPATRKILAFIQQRYGKLVFTKRWLRPHFKPFEIEFALRAMLQDGILHSYAPLGEQTKGIVAQAEHTLLVGEPAIVLTRNNV
jgi:methionyl aminopeptidase